MKKFVAAAAAGLAALALPSLPAAADAGPVTAAHLAASGVAVLMWAAAIAGLMAMRSGRNLRWWRARRRPITDDELRQLVGMPPAARANPSPLGT